ncbi:MAG: hypothetical protein ACR2LQ_05320 [Acidimicrobiales bacterium]
MATQPVESPSQPPKGYFSIWQRLLRGYGPLAVLAVLLVAMSLLVPSKVQKAATSGPTTTAPGNSAGPAGGATTGAGATADSAGSAGSAGASGTETANGGGAVAAGAGCPDRAEQVTGDPYSPPCIAFSGENGGATTKGVTATEIHVAFRVLDEKGFQQTLAQLAGANLVDTPDTVRNTVTALAEYFNKSFQFYGRKIVIDFYNGVGSSTNELLGQGIDKAEADGDTVASMGDFADLSGATEPYGDALYKRQVVGFGVPYLSREWMSSRRPYSWSLATDCSIVTETVADYALKRLLDQPAINAGGALQGQPRVATAIAPDNPWYQECVRAGEDILRANRGGKSWDVAPIAYQLDLGTMSNQAANLVPKLQSQGITTIVCGCDPIFPVFLSGAAARAGYFPEFINIGVALDDFDLVGQLWQPDFVKHSFGISPLGDDASKPSTQSIGYAAYKSVRQDEPAFSVDLIYYQMYMFATGIQMAGPTLTPDSFEAGMFAYPKKLGPAGLWGYGPGDYTPQDDVREIYWDPNTVSQYNSKKGAWVDPNPGARYGKGQIPAGVAVSCGC